MKFNKITGWMDESEDQMVELQKKLTAIPALNPEMDGEGEWKKAKFLESWLADQGLPPVAHYDTPDERVPEDSRPNFVLNLPGKTESPRLWIMSHLDIVPPGEQKPDGTWAGWDSDPFTVRREGDSLYGRGVEDNQQAIVSSIFAALALYKHNITPKYPVSLLFVSAEETGSEYGLQSLLEEHSHIFSKDDIILVPDGGSEDGSLIEIAEKSVLWIKLHVSGKQTHSSTPQLGCNAFRSAARLVTELDRNLHERFDAEDDLFSPPHSTFEPTSHDRNVLNINTVPGKETLHFDCRVLPEYDLDDVLDCFRSTITQVDSSTGSKTRIEIENRLDAPAPTLEDCPAVELLKNAIKEIYGVNGRPKGIGGSTVAAFFRKAEYNAVVWSRLTATAHQANEHCKISNMIGDAKVFAHVMLSEEMKKK
jgi:succinyl-diaminopimelate desuccinylase